MQLWSCAKLGADIIRTPTRAEVERRLGVSLWGPRLSSAITKLIYVLSLGAIATVIFDVAKA
jgi:hypothetical protein